MEEFSSFCAKCISIGHVLSDCRPLPSTVYLSAPATAIDINVRIPDSLVLNVTLCNGNISVVDIDHSVIVGIGIIGGYDGVDIAPFNHVLVDADEVVVPLDSEGMGANNCKINFIATPIFSPTLVDDVVDVHCGGYHPSLPMGVDVPIGSEVIDIPISFISNEILKSHLVGNLENNYLEQNDWLEDYGSSPCGGDGDDLDRPEDAIQARYNLNVNRIVEKVTVVAPHGIGDDCLGVHFGRLQPFDSSVGWSSSVAFFGSLTGY
ncbi:hypothetical protein M5K25_022135 [Dendrobium thyrsiflorum]|uniref:Uncharacterized protein n=1 Tax=Dendrobium thyrsiflorum TaxID=117978 RepID=A0ABD0U5R4_DENTH